MITFGHSGMTKIFSTVFSALILFQSLNISIEDFSKLNTLIEHANYHNEKYGDSFFEFLAEHYNASMFHTNDEHKEHQELPFKTQHDNWQQTANSFTFEFSCYQFINKSFVYIPFNYYYKESSTYFEKPCVFQPPKLV